ncbi:dynein light chain Tctex-type 3 isoform X1 [Egretta garzetta]|uniref:dynein light chain Tctex-type 3 isoform X1 n=1 Tax=Egretta garzetta TaxID=188379 RepID=UPI00163B8AB8|nr:dynein light chain Tctex-type 3 isoform X1 [Egretta garzetta]
MIFNADEAHNIVKECIESVLGKADYNHNKVNQWTAAIVEQSLTHLVKLGKTYKYIDWSRNAACYWSVVSERSQPALSGKQLSSSATSAVPVRTAPVVPFRVTCAVMQRSGAGLHTASSCFWDTTTDGTCTVRWENRTMNCIVNVFAVAIIL